MTQKKAKSHLTAKVIIQHFTDVLVMYFLSKTKNRTNIVNHQNVKVKIPYQEGGLSVNPDYIASPTHISTKEAAPVQIKMGTHLLSTEEVVMAHLVRL